MEELEDINGGMTVRELQEKYPKKSQREAMLWGMSNEEIQEIIDSCGTPQGKVYYSQFLKK